MAVLNRRVLAVVCLSIVISFAISGSATSAFTSVQENSPEKNLIEGDTDWHKHPDTKIFDSGGNNSGEEIYVGTYYQNLGNIRGKERPFVNKVQRQYDFFYNTTSPVMRYAGNKSLGGESPGDKYGLSLLHSHEFRHFVTKHTGGAELSNRTDNSPAPAQGEYIKDAHITVEGIIGSATIQTNTDVNGLRVVPYGGAVLQWGDFRVNVTEQKQCKRNDTHRMCTETELLDQRMENNRLVVHGDNDTEKVDAGERYWAVLPYGDLEGYGGVAFRGRADAVVEIEFTNTTYKRDSDGGGWELVDKTVEIKEERLALSDSTSRYRIGDVQIKQYVIREPDEDKMHLRLALQTESGEEVSNPDKHPSAFLWQLLSFEHGGSLKNIWGVYSVANEFQMHQYTEDEIKSEDGPVYPELYITPRYKFVKDRHGGGTKVVGNITSVTQSGFSVAHGNIVLQTPNSSQTYSELYLTNAISEVEAVTSITKSRIPVDTERGELVEPKLKAKKINENGAEFRLTDPNGEPLGGRTLYLDGAVRANVTLDEDGTARVIADGSEVTATFHGFSIAGVGTDELEDATSKNGSKYYTEATETVRFESSLPLSNYLFSIAQGFATLSGILVVLTLFWWAAQTFRH